MIFGLCSAICGSTARGAGFPNQLIGKSEDAGIKPRLLEALCLPAFEIAANLLVAQVDATRQHTCRKFRATRLAGRLIMVITEKIAIEL